MKLFKKKKIFRIKKSENNVNKLKVNFIDFYFTQKIYHHILPPKAKNQLKSLSN